MYVHNKTLFLRLKDYAFILHILVKPSTFALSKFYNSVPSLSLREIQASWWFQRTCNHLWNNNVTKREKRWMTPITLLLFFIEMLQYDWLWSGHMIINEMFYIPIKLKPELARASMTTSDVNNQWRSNFQQQII